jgi:c(7)-type cytochrome triheme protein
MRITGSVRDLVAPGGPWLAGFVLTFIAVTVFLRGSAGHAGPQPIAFNHSKHIAAGLECTNCHEGAQTAEHATIPALAVCVACHESALTKSPEEAKLRAFAAAGREIPWHPVTHVPAHVYFSHRRHVALAKIECTTCHGEMGKLSAPPSAPARRLDMQTCISCHESKQARTDCNDCHR